MQAFQYISPFTNDEWVDLQTSKSYGDLLKSLLDNATVYILDGDTYQASYLDLENEAGAYQLLVTEVFFPGIGVNGEDEFWNCENRSLFVD